MIFILINANAAFPLVCLYFLNLRSILKRYFWKTAWPRLIRLRLKRERKITVWLHRRNYHTMAKKIYFDQLFIIQNSPKIRCKFRNVVTIHWQSLSVVSHYRCAVLLFKARGMNSKQTGQNYRATSTFCAQNQSRVRKKGAKLPIFALIFKQFKVQRAITR